MTRIFLSGLLTVSIAMGITSTVNAQFQPAPGISNVKPPVQLAPNTFITGRLQLVSCNQPINTLGIEVQEYFYVQNGDSFEIPKTRTPSGGGYFNDRLQLGNMTLQQGKVLGATTINSNMTFKAGWYEPLLTVASGPKMPWIENVQHVTATGTRNVTAYRVLRLRLTISAPPPPPNALWTTSFIPEPAVTFFGNERSKEVGTLRTSCSGFNF